MEELRQIGARTVPVVSRGKNFVFAQFIRDVVDFLELEDDTAQNCRQKNWPNAMSLFWRLQSA